MTLYAPHYRRTAHGLFTALPDLPAGWLWIQSPNSWLIARKPDGKEFYVDFHAGGQFTLSLRGTATLWDWIRTGGELKRGAMFCDRRHQHLSADFRNLKPNTPIAELS